MAGAQIKGQNVAIELSKEKKKNSREKSGENNWSREKSNDNNWSRKKTRKKY